MTQPIHTDLFVAEGRGPELQQVYWSGRGTILRAISYFNPDDAHDDVHIKHVRFRRAQVVRLTPEEVIGDHDLGEHWVIHRNAAMFDLGRSAWLQSLNPRHLTRCRHFQLMFYDELFDVIAEDVECSVGDFREGAG